VIRILSDLHLGHTASRIQDVAQLAPLFEGSDEIIFAGDVWQEKEHRSERPARMFSELRELVGAQGIFLRGNHDPGTEQGIAWLAGKSVLVTHGDAVYRDATPWSREMSPHRKAVEEIVSRYDGEDAQACSDRARDIALTIKPIPLPKLPVPLNFLATALWPPSRTLEMFRVWSTMGEECLRFLERVSPESRVVICGHFHRAGSWEKEGRVAINTGSFMRTSRPWCVDIDDEWVTAREVTFSDGWKAGKVKGRWIVKES
jgi:predicted phosphodiesterase